ncbi:MAG: 3-deoxy-manno-octulosonate cytidylyltransferase [SAR86 cluster bacterium]|nr:3-deoxy-manno-octulosonate cytidylyltransferase [SAR86 cluster bacterium]
MARSFSIVIPARLASTRLPEKLLKVVKGKPLIQWTWENALKTKAANVTVVTDSKEIFTAIHSKGGQSFMTAEHHETGTDRINEYITEANLSDDELIINLQGDEPLLSPDLVNDLADFMIDNNFNFSTLCKPFESDEELKDINKVKVQLSEDQKAVAFSREPLGNLSVKQNFHHIGVYGYSAGMLTYFAGLEQTKNEKREKLEQLRALDNNLDIHVLKIDECRSFGIDTLEDLNKFEGLLTNEN